MSKILYILIGVDPRFKYSPVRTRYAQLREMHKCGHRYVNSENTIGAIPWKRFQPKPIPRKNKRKGKHFDNANNLLFPTWRCSPMGFLAMLTKQFINNFDTWNGYYTCRYFEQQKMGSAWCHKCMRKHLGTEADTDRDRMRTVWGLLGTSSISAKQMAAQENTVCHKEALSGSGTKR